MENVEQETVLFGAIQIIHDIVLGHFINILNIALGSGEFCVAERLSI
jgi:hypothetical protein